MQWMNAWILAERESKSLEMRLSYCVAEDLLFPCENEEVEEDEGEKGNPEE